MHVRTLMALVTGLALGYLFAPTGGPVTALKINSHTTSETIRGIEAPVTRSPGGRGPASVAPQNLEAGNGTAEPRDLDSLLRKWPVGERFAAWTRLQNEWEANAIAKHFTVVSEGDPNLRELRRSLGLKRQSPVHYRGTGEIEAEGKKFTVHIFSDYSLYQTVSARGYDEEGREIEELTGEHVSAQSRLVFISEGKRLMEYGAALGAGELLMRDGRLYMSVKVYFVERISSYLSALMIPLDPRASTPLLYLEAHGEAWKSDPNFRWSAGREDMADYMDLNRSLDADN